MANIRKVESIWALNSLTLFLILSDDSEQVQCGRNCQLCCDSRSKSSNPANHFLAGKTCKKVTARLWILKSMKKREEVEALIQKREKVFWVEPFSRQSKVLSWRRVPPEIFILSFNFFFIYNWCSSFFKTAQQGTRRLSACMRNLCSVMTGGSPASHGKNLMLAFSLRHIKLDLIFWTLHCNNFHWFFFFFFYSHTIFGDPDWFDLAQSTN